MDNNDFKEGLLKVAGELRGLADALREQSAQEAREKTAAVSFESQDLSLGEIGGAQPSTDPLTDFCLS